MPARTGAQFLDGLSSVPDAPGNSGETLTAVAVFDDVHVPYQRCLILGDPELCNGFYSLPGGYWVD